MFQANRNLQHDQWRAVFQKVDDDANGVLDVDEFEQVPPCPCTLAALLLLTEPPLYCRP